MAKTNGKSLTSDDEAKMRKMVADLAIDSHGTEDKLTILDMFKHGQAMKTLILCLAWIMTCISFYAIGLNSSDLAGNIIVNYMLSRTAGLYFRSFNHFFNVFMGKTYEKITSESKKSGQIAVVYRYLL